MSFHPLDLVSDVDLRAYEGQLLSRFGAVFDDKRTKALEDWLFPILTANGFDPYRLVTRAEVTKAFGYTGSVYTDLTTACQDTTDDDLNLATVLATVGTDALYLGSTRPFRGLFVRMTDSVSAVAGTLAVAYFNGVWSSLALADGTTKAAGKPFSGGGSVSWTLPTDWQRRKVNGSDALYWAKVTISATPTSAKAGQIGVIRASCLRAAATFRTLQLIFQDAKTSTDGPWDQKADLYKGEADLALQRALQVCGGEFDTDDSDQIGSTEETQTAAEASTKAMGGVVLERG